MENQNYNQYENSNYSPNYNPNYNQNYNANNNSTIPPQYKPLSPWAYMGYNLLFAIPLVGLILLIVFSFNDDNINRRNYARSFFCLFLLGLILFIIIFILALGIGLSVNS